MPRLYCNTCKKEPTITGITIDKWEVDCGHQFIRIHYINIKDEDKFPKCLSIMWSCANCATKNKCSNLNNNIK